VYEAKDDKQLDLGPTASSLDLLQVVYRDPSIALTTRMRAAMACLPFETPKLAVTAQITEQDFATLLERRLKRLEEMKLIEANGGKLINAKPIGKANEPQCQREVETKPQVETKPPLARTPDRRFRRF